jgi:hypothetical protein
VCVNDDLGCGSVRVLRDVRQRLRDHVVGSYLYRRGQPPLGM